MSKNKKKVFGTGEWAKFNANSSIGCSNNCRYCYSKDAFEKNNKDGASWTDEKSDEKAINKVWNKKEGTIMFPTRHDITSNTIDDALKVLKGILVNGNNVLIVSKPHLACIKTLCSELKEYKDKILFRFSIGSTDNDVLGFWELSAPKFEERLASLKYAFDEGFKTSVSAEPLLDNELSKTLKLVSSLEDYITDSLWIGKMNKVDIRVKDVSEDDLNKYLRYQTDENIIDIYNALKDNSKIKWKESFKEVIGIDVPTERGLDI